MPSRRKSTDMVKRRAKSQVNAELEEKVLSPQEQRRKMMITIGVWFLIIAFCATSGIICFSIGSNEKMMKAQEEAIQQDPTQAEIDRWSHEVEQSPTDATALANLGYYWGQKAQELDSQPAAKADANKDEKNDKPVVTKEQALNHAHEYLERAIKADPNYTFALQKYAELCVYEKNNAKAREMLEKVIVAASAPIPEGEDKEALEANALSQKGQAVVTLATLDMNEKNYAAAEQRLNDLLKEQPGNLQAFIAKGNLLISMENGDKRQALEAFGSALKIANSVGRAEEALNCWIARANIYKELGEKENAKKELQACKDFFQGNPMVAASVDTLMKQIDGNAPAAKTAAPAEPAAAPAEPAAAPAEPAAAPAEPAAAPAEPAQ